MKFVKRIGVFLVYPCVLLGMGFFFGVKATHFFYPGDQTSYGQHMEEAEYGSYSVSVQTKEEPPSATAQYGEALLSGEPVGQYEEMTASVRQAAASSETLCVDTEYVLEETDLRNHTVVETVWRLPDKYVGMNREQFLEAMENYEAFPPLSEQERGFVGLEVKSFSRKRVVVQMNYHYVQPSVSFYLAVYDNEVLVYLDDMETVYIETDIRLDTLPESLQQEIIQMLWLEDEEALYNFLESYSS